MKQHIILTVTSLLALLLFVASSPTIIELEFDAESRDTFQIYWSTTDSFDEARSLTQGYKKGFNFTNFVLPRFSYEKSIRFDPTFNPNRIKLLNIKVSKKGFQTLDILGSKKIDKINFNSALKVEPLDQGMLSLTSISSDPNFLVEINLKPDLLFCFAFFFLGYLILWAILSSAKLISIIKIGCSFLIFAYIITSLLANANINLSNNKDWVVGKNLGKYLFQTFEFMASPITNKGLVLSNYMGYQEVYLAQKFNENQTLLTISADIKLSSSGYIWLLFNKNNGSR